MNRIVVAQELVKLAKELTAASKQMSLRTRRPFRANDFPVDEMIQFRLDPFDFQGTLAEMSPGEPMKMRPLTEIEVGADYEVLETSGNSVVLLRDGDAVKNDEITLPLNLLNRLRSAIEKADKADDDLF